MATQIPTFLSGATTGTASMGIVQPRGGEAQISALSAWNNVYEKIGAISNDYLNKQMEFEMTQKASQDVLAKGLNPKDLSNPVTTADRIYRQSALNTYAMQTEVEVSRHINELALEHSRDPVGFAKSAEPYARNVVANSAPELAPGLAKMVGSAIDKHQYAISSAHQQRVIAANEAAERAAVSRLTMEAASARTPAERAEKMAKAYANIENSTVYITPQSKQEAKLGLESEVLYQATLLDVGKNDITPVEAIERLEAEGLATNERVNQIYARAGVVHDHEMRQLNKRKAQAEAKVQAVVSEAFYETLAIGGAEGDLSTTTQMYDSIKSELVTKMQEMRATPEQVQSAIKAVDNARYGMGVDNETALYHINKLIADSDPDAESAINKLALSGAIKPQTALEKTQEALKAKAGILNNPTVKGFLSQYQTQFAPYAVSKGETESINLYQDEKRKERAKRDTAIMSDMEMRINDMHVNKNMSASEIVSQLETDARANKEPVRTSKALAGTLPPEITDEADTTMNSDTFNYVSGYVKSRGQFVPQYAADEGKFTKDNYQKRLKAMQRANILAEKQGLAKPYKDDVLAAIKGVFAE